MFICIRGGLSERAAVLSAVGSSIIDVFQMTRKA